MITPDEKQSIFEAARETMQSWYGLELAERGACLYWNQCAMRELHLRGHEPILQAGTLLWRMVPDARDDGQQATHFGFEWTPEHPFSINAVNAGLLPEVHIWAALPKENAIVDFSTGYIAQYAKHEHGYDWLTLPPPDYVFGIPPRDAFYKPHAEAIKFVWRFILEKFTETAPA